MQGGTRLWKFKGEFSQRRHVVPARTTAPGRDNEAKKFLPSIDYSVSHAFVFDDINGGREAERCPFWSLSDFT
jgi:hypothetical protein